VLYQKGKCTSISPSGLKNSQTKETRDQAQEIAETSEGKDEKQKRRDVINWRRECAIMKKTNQPIQEVYKWARL